MHSESPNLPETPMTPECVRLHPAALTGTIPAVDAKSYAHRLLMAAALADVPTRIRCRHPRDGAGDARAGGGD